MQRNRNQVTPTLNLKSHQQAMGTTENEKDTPQQKPHNVSSGTIDAFAANQNRNRQGRGKFKKGKSTFKQLRFEKVISGIKGVEGKKLDELRVGIKLQVKSLFKFLCAFIVYACLGGLVFFYVEECSGLSNAGDNSIPVIGNTYTKAEFKDVTGSCLQLYNEALGLNLTSNVASNSSDFLTFKRICAQVFSNSTNDFVTKGHSTNCVWDEFMLLKYAEYTIFTLLTIGMIFIYS